MRISGNADSHQSVFVLNWIIANLLMKMMVYYFKKNLCGTGKLNGRGIILFWYNVDLIEQLQEPRTLRN